MIKIEHNVETNKIMNVEMTKAEIDQLKKDEAVFEKKNVDVLAKAEAKASAQAKLAAFGLTEEEVASILG